MVSQNVFFSVKRVSGPRVEQWYCFEWKMFFLLFENSNMNCIFDEVLKRANWKNELYYNTSEIP